MPEQYDNNNKASLWKNEPPPGKSLHPKAPMYTGKAQIDNKTYRVAAWPVQSDNPKAPKVRMDFTPEDEAAPQGTGRIESPQDDDDVPF